MKINDIVKIKPHSAYINGMQVPNLFIEQEWKIIRINNGIVTLQQKQGWISVNLYEESLILVEEAPEIKIHYFRVAKSLDDENISKYSNYDTALRACQISGSGYSIFNDEDECVYTFEDLSIRVGDEVSIKTGARYASGGIIPERIMKSKCYVRMVDKFGNFALSTSSTGRIFGSVKPEDLVKYGFSPDGMEPYVALIIHDNVNVHTGPSDKYKILETINAKDSLYTITEEQNGFGRLKINQGWIDLKHIKKV